jgi:hypothetical protein
MPDRKTEARIIIGAIAGHHFHGRADMQAARHCFRGLHHGYFMVRKRLRNRAAFNYDPTLGWEIDRWFEWDETEAAKDGKVT